MARNYTIFVLQRCTDFQMDISVYNTIPNYIVQGFKQASKKQFKQK